MTPEDELYFDHYTSLYDDEPVAAGGYTPLREVYAWEPPMPGQITGIQGQLWSEYLPTEKQALYMLHPRLLALAETAWGPENKKSWPSFLERLRQKSPSLVPQEVVLRTSTPSPGAVRVSWKATEKYITSWTMARYRLIRRRSSFGNPPCCRPGALQAPRAESSAVRSRCTGHRGVHQTSATT